MRRVFLNLGIKEGGEWSLGVVKEIPPNEALAGSICSPPNCT